MLVIRKDQQSLLARPSFEAWVVEHAHRCFAEECEEMGPEGTARFVREMIDRARGHGFHGGVDICQFVDLGLTFGADFETTCPWAGPVLAEANGHADSNTLDALYELGLAELDRDEEEGGEEEDIGNEDDATTPEGSE